MSNFSLFKIKWYIHFIGIERFYTFVMTKSSERKEIRGAKRRLDAVHGGYNGSKKEFKETVVKYWKKYGIKPQKFWYDLFCDGKKSYDPRYIPNSLWHTKIIPYFNYFLVRKAYRDKGMYHRLLRDVKQPETVAKRMAGYYYNGDGEQLITREEAIRLCEREEHLIFKPSVDSGGGRSIAFFDRDDPSREDISALFDEFGTNVVVQRLVKQHPDLGRINGGNSLNTVRVMTFHFKEEIHVLSAQLRMGGVNSRVDNVTAGGCACAIKEDGWLEEKAVTRKSVWTDHHESGIKFRDIRVPSYEKIIETSKRLHKEMPFYNIIGWDFAVDEEGEPVFIEMNFQPDQNQFASGPSFGDLSDEVLEDVFIQKSLKGAFNEFETRKP